MAIIAKKSGTGFIPCPEGTHAAVCVDVVDLGILEVTFGGKKKQQHKIRIVWQIEETRADGKPYEAHKRYTLSLHEKAALRKDLESWRGRAFTDTELNGFDVESILGAPGLLNIMQTTNEGSTYANVTAIMKLPKSMFAPPERDYVRVIDRNPGEHTETPGNDFGGITDEDVPF